jgi:hypothetical protein
VGTHTSAEEQLAHLLGDVVEKIQLPERVANAISARLHASQTELEQARGRSSTRLLDRQRALQAKIDRGYDDYVERRISDALWARKSAEWETELVGVTAEVSALHRPTTSFVTTGERILELVKRAGILYKTQDLSEQRRLLESVLSNCTFDRGSVCPTYKGHSICSPAGTKQENGGVDGTRTRGLCRDRAAF